MNDEVTNQQTSEGCEASEYSDLLSVPSSWKRGEALQINKMVIRGGNAWTVERIPDFDYRSDIPMDAIAMRWFYTWEEFSKFIQWWYRGCPGRLEFQPEPATSELHNLVMCGYCKDCKHRSSLNRCENDEKIEEDYGQPNKSDMLIYDYLEGGGFTVGDYFGCVHFKQK